ncbi:MAG: ABC transporter permease subunit [Acidobacteriia bacterium]|nr:ABC transporter permease subunit [Terriglobia bacterium]
MKLTKFTWVDLVLLLTVAVFLVFVFAEKPRIYPRTQTQLNLSLTLLPLYALYSLLRMIVAYIFSLGFSIWAGYQASTSIRARRIILPALDILQSVPILGFFPAAVYFFIRLAHGSPIGAEAAAVFLIFTSQAWNMAFAAYESLTTIPEDLLLASGEFRLTGVHRWIRLLLPSCVPKLSYNSMLSWAAGWFFLIASEIIAIGNANYTLPGLGSYLQQSLDRGRNSNFLLGLLTLIAVVSLLHFVLWAPLLEWAERFRYEMTAGGSSEGGSSWVLKFVKRSELFRYIQKRILGPALERGPQMLEEAFNRVSRRAIRATSILFLVIVLIGFGYGAFQIVKIVIRPWPLEALSIPLALLYSFLRLLLAYAISIAWTLPVAALISRSPRWSRTLLPIAEILASVPATAFFPLIVVLVLRQGANSDLPSVLLVLTGMQWYLLFNLIGGIQNIPADMREVAQALRLRGWRYMRRVLIPAVIPSLITGSITAWGGGWNALVLSEFVKYGEQTYGVTGIGAMLVKANDTGNIQMVLATVLSMVIVVTSLNRFFWRRAYDYASRKFTLEY